MAFDKRREPGRLASLLVIAALAGGLAACNEHPVDYAEASGAIEHVKEFEGDQTAAMDLLWVIDNSGSMCQEQEQLRQNFNGFIERLDETNLDFNIAVTTTHLENSSFYEKVARPGHIQSTPHPASAFDEVCHYATNDDGELLNGSDVDGDGEPEGPDFGPVRTQIEQAVACTANPEQYEELTNVSQQELDCFVTQDEDACNAIGEDHHTYGPEALFPPQDAYREISPVLRAEDYREDGVLNVERLREDFACVSFVGTRGSSFEQGLQAATRAVSPEMTGGPADVSAEAAADDEILSGFYDTEAPNHGFLRRNAQFGVIFVTDENDCSHDGNLDTRNSCGDGVCYIHTAEGAEDSPLLSTEALYEDFMANLAKSKGLERDELNEEQVLAASIHGPYNVDVFDGNPPSEEQCREIGADVVKPECTTTRLGSAKSGSRYEDFIRQFQNYFPEPAGNADHLTPYMCREGGDLQPALDAMGKFFRAEPAACITEPIYPCSEGGDCPAYEFGEGASNVCQPFGASGEGFCDSAVQVIARVPEGDDSGTAPAERLRNTDHCIEESIGSEGLENGCVIARDTYSWSECPGAQSGGILFQWENSTQSQQVLSGLELQIRYTELASTSDEADAGTGGDAANMSSMMNNSGAQ